MKFLLVIMIASITITWHARADLLVRANNPKIINMLRDRAYGPKLPSQMAAAKLAVAAKVEQDKKTIEEEWRNKYSNKEVENWPIRASDFYAHPLNVMSIKPDVKRFSVEVTAYAYAPDGETYRGQKKSKYDEKNRKFRAYVKRYLVDVDSKGHAGAVVNKDGSGVNIDPSESRAWFTPPRCGEAYIHPPPNCLPPAPPKDDQAALVVN